MARSLRYNNARIMNLKHSYFRSEEDDGTSTKYTRLEDDGNQDKERFAR